MSPQEKRVLHLAFVEGMTNEEIGKKLYITVHTVKTYLRNVHDKADVGGLRGIMAYCFKQGLIEWKGDESKTQVSPVWS